LKEITKQSFFLERDIKMDVVDCQSSIKGLVHPKMKILSVFTHPHVKSESSITPP